MPSIKFVSGEERVFVDVAALVAANPEFADLHAQMESNDLAGATCNHHDGDEHAPQLFEVRYPAGHRVEAHAHDVDEIVAVTDGSMRFGQRSYGVGSSVFIPAYTLYSFEAGSEGVTFLNFRPHRSDGLITKAEFVAGRRDPNPGAPS